MVETLLSTSEVLLYAEPVTDMSFSEKEGDGVERAEIIPNDVRNFLSTDIKQKHYAKSDRTAILNELTSATEDFLLKVELGGSGADGRVSGGLASGRCFSGSRMGGGKSD